MNLLMQMIPCSKINMAIVTLLVARTGFYTISESDCPNQHHDWWRTGSDGHTKENIFFSDLTNKAPVLKDYLHLVLSPLDGTGSSLKVIR